MLFSLIGHDCITEGCSPWCVNVGVKLFVCLTKSSPFVLAVEANSKCKMLKPREGKSLRVVPIRRFSPTNSVLKSPNVTARETRSTTTARETRSIVTRKRVVSLSSSSDCVEVVKEVPAPIGALSNKPQSHLSKRQLASSDKEEDEGDGEPLTRGE